MKERGKKKIRLCGLLSLLLFLTLFSGCKKKEKTEAKLLEYDSFAFSATHV